jgi:hypothetical protein
VRCALRTLRTPRTLRTRRTLLRTLRTLPMQVLFSGGGAQPPFAGATAKALTNDHKPEDAEEQKRITAAGGKRSMVRRPRLGSASMRPRLLRAARGGSRRRGTPKGRDRPATGLPSPPLP